MEEIDITWIEAAVTGGSTVLLALIAMFGLFMGHKIVMSMVKRESDYDRDMYRELRELENSDIRETGIGYGPMSEPGTATAEDSAAGQYDGRAGGGGKVTQSDVARWRAIESSQTEVKDRDYYDTELGKMSEPQGRGF